MKKYKSLATFVLLSISLLVSCSVRKERTTPLINMISSNNFKSTVAISTDNEQVVGALETKTTMRDGKEQSLYWYKKALTIQYASDSMINYIKEMLSALRDEASDNKDRIFDNQNNKSVKDVFITSGRGKDLFIKLTNWGDKILRTDTMINLQFRSMINRNRGAVFDSSRKNDFPESYFVDATAAEGYAYLTGLTNEITLDENNILHFCLSHAGHPPYRDCCGPRLLVTQSSTYVKPGETIKLTVAIGEYADEMKPVIQINNKSEPIHADGSSDIHITASYKPGKYTVPVKVTVTDEDGNNKTIEDKVSYEVAPVQ